MKILRTITFLVTLSFLASCGGDNCPDGFEGIDCMTESRDKFIGTWTSTNYSCSMDGSFGFDIERGEAVDEMILVIFDDGNLSEFVVTVSEFQFGLVNDEIEINGSLIIDNNILFTITSDATLGGCSGSFMM